MGNRQYVEGKTVSRRVVTLRNLSASYTTEERALMRGLPECEQPECERPGCERCFIHEAKARFGGKLT